MKNIGLMAMGLGALLLGCDPGTAHTGNQNNDQQNQNNNTNQPLVDGSVRDGALQGDAGPSSDAAPDPDAAPQPDAAPIPCGAGCPANAWCDPQTDTCVCHGGFQDDGQGSCVAIDPGDPALRTQGQMCNRWSSDHQHTASVVFAPGPNACDLGVVEPAALADTVSFINVYRYLCGLQPLDDDPTSNDAAQHCAVIQHAMGGLDHDPPPTAPCYTTLGANTAGSSNLGQGHPSPASAIDSFIDDWPVTSLGHRRWVLHPNYGPAGIGYVSSFTCLRVFSWSTTGSVPYIAWPNQGFTPIDVLPPVWSFGSMTLILNNDTEVTVVRLSDSAPLQVSSYLTYGDMWSVPTVGFSPSGWSAQADETYEITITDPNTGPLAVYDVTPVHCP